MNEFTLKSLFKSVIAKDEVLKQTIIVILDLTTDCFVASLLAMTSCYIWVQKILIKMDL